jgi:hypothetical protein
MNLCRVAKDLHYLRRACRLLSRLDSLEKITCGDFFKTLRVFRPAKGVTFAGLLEVKRSMNRL